MTISSDWSHREAEVVQDLCALPDNVSLRIIAKYLKTKVSHEETGPEKIVASVKMVAGILEEVNNDDS